jgi:HK97 family phage major capsid protein
MTVTRRRFDAQIRARLTLAADDTGDTPDGPIMLEGLAVPWNTTVQLNWWGDTVEFLPGSIDPPDAAHVKLLLDHRAKPFGYGVDFTNTAEGLHARMAIPRDELDDTEVATAVRQLRNGVRDALSVGVVIDASNDTVDQKRDITHVAVTAGELLELSSVVIPRFSKARVTKIAASAASADDPEDPDDDPDPDDPEEDMPTTTDDDTDVEADRRDRHNAARSARPGPATRAGRAGRYPTFGAYARACATGLLAADDPYRMLVAAALADQTTADISGIVPEQWMRDLIDLMSAVTPVVQAFSQRPLPDAGMVVTEPRVDQGPDVGVQAVEKTDIASRKVLISPVPFPVLTYAGGQDISIQALLRSDPSYLDELMRLYAREMAIQIDIAAGAALIADTPPANTTPVTAATLNDAFVDAAAAVLGRIWALPTVTILGVNLWKVMGKAVGTDGRPLFPGLSPANPVGSFSLTDTSGNVRGLGYYVDPWIDADTGVVGVPDAFRTRLGTIGTLTSDVPQKLGRDVAVYRFATMGVTDGRGLQLLTLSGAGATARSASK